MNFSKMEGLGNDFIVFEGSVEVDAELVRKLCDRHFGIGADGVLRVGQEGDFIRMDYWNADGGMAEMCGNGLRCVALYAYDNGLVESKTFVVKTAVGDRRVEIGDLISVELGPVTMGEPRDWNGMTFHAVSVGNPHLVTLGKDPTKIDVASIGKALELATPGGTNVGFGSVVGSGINLRVWERGVGETLACGSGMVAAAALAHRLQLTGPEMAIKVPGGDAIVEIEDTTTWLTGPARLVFRGELP